MSQYNNKNKNQKQVVPQPFCKVCKDSDKSEAMYTSHWVKDKQGKVCCPTLLSQQCRYCNNHGHTIKFCKFAVEDNNRSKLVLKVVTKAPAVKLANKPQPTLMSNNRWTALAEALADAPAQALAEEYPSLSPNVTLRPHQKQFATLTFAAVAAIPLAFPQVTPQVIQKSAPVKFSRNWADDDSSDEEEEQQYDCASGCNSSIISDDEPDQEMSFYYRQQVAAF
jgi:Nanos RNA binding domain